MILVQRQMLFLIRIPGYIRTFPEPPGKYPEVIIDVLYGRLIHHLIIFSGMQGHQHDITVCEHAGVKQHPFAIRTNGMMRMSFTGKGTFAVGAVTGCQQFNIVLIFQIQTVQFSVKGISHRPFQIGRAVGMPISSSAQIGIFCNFMGSDL